MGRFSKDYPFVVLNRTAVIEAFVAGDAASQEAPASTTGTAGGGRRSAGALRAQRSEEQRKAREILFPEGARVQAARFLWNAGHFL